MEIFNSFSKVGKYEISERQKIVMNNHKIRDKIKNSEKWKIGKEKKTYW